VAGGRTHAADKAADAAGAGYADRSVPDHFVFPSNASNSIADCAAGAYRRSVAAGRAL
jgi:hypothetical protein